MAKQNSFWNQDLLRILTFYDVAFQKFVLVLQWLTPLLLLLFLLLLKILFHITFAFFAPPRMQRWTTKLAQVFPCVLCTISLALTFFSGWKGKSVVRDFPFGYQSPIEQQGNLRWAKTGLRNHILPVISIRISICAEFYSFLRYITLSRIQEISQGCAKIWLGWEFVHQCLPVSVTQSEKKESSSIVS